MVLRRQHADAGAQPWKVELPGQPEVHLGHRFDVALELVGDFDDVEGGEQGIEARHAPGELEGYAFFRQAARGGVEVGPFVGRKDLREESTDALRSGTEMLDRARQL